MEGPTPNLETLLAQTEFVRRVAGELIRDPATADDVAQETMLKALRQPRPSRGWLYTVTRNLARTQARGAGRRRVHERAASKPDNAAAADELVARAEVHRRVVSSVLELEEPYRQMILLRYFEDLPPREIAKRTATPVETVRVRLRRALAHLRGRLDDLHRGDRRSWCIALLPLAAPRTATAGMLSTGVAIMTKKAALIAVVAATAGSTLTFVATSTNRSDARAASTGAEAWRRDERAIRLQLEQATDRLRQTELALEQANATLRRTSTADGANVSTEAQRTRVAQLRAEMDGWFERGEAQHALAALRELLAMKTEGWPLAMELWLKIRNDSGRGSDLGLSDMAASTALDDPATIPVLEWALENPAPADFRLQAAWSLPWSRPLERTLEQYRRILPIEKDPAVQWALIESLAGMQTDDSQAALLAALRDFTATPNARGMVATRLVQLAQWITHGKPETDPGATWIRAVRATAASDPGAEARAAAAAALTVLAPDATGFLVTGFSKPDALAKQAGVMVGDIIVAYDRRPVPDGGVLHGLSRSWADGPREVEFVVVRDSEKLTLRAKRSALGVYGLAATR